MAIAVKMQTKLRPLVRTDWKSVSQIYAEGIATGLATFETKVPNWESWNKKYITFSRIVAEIEHKVVGFAVLSRVSNRAVYQGVAEVSLYVTATLRGGGIGKKLLMESINQSEKNGFWTLQASIFSENVQSIELHKKCGFRVVGIKEKIGQLNGKWYDNHFLERRSKLVGI